MPTVLPPSGNNGFSGENNNLIKLDLDPTILDSIFRSKPELSKKIKADFNFNKTESIGKLRELFLGDNPLALREKFFHFLKAIPAMSKVLDFEDTNLYLQVHNHLNTFSFGDNLLDSVTILKETWLLVNHLVLEAKSKTKNPQAQKVLDEILNYSVSSIVSLASPESINMTGSKAFNPRDFLETETMRIAGLVEEASLKAVYAEFIQKISDSDKFKSLIDLAYDQAEAIDTLREEVYANDDDLQRSLFDSKLMRENLNVARQGFSRLTGLADNYIRANKNKSGFNGKFEKLLNSELKSRDFPHVAFNFQDYDSGELENVEKRIELTTKVLDDLTKLGYKEWGFANFLSDYGYGNLAHELIEKEGLDADKVRSLVSSFLNSDNTIESFLSFVQAPSLRDSDDDYTNTFVELLNNLKKTSIEKDIKISLFSPNVDDEEYEAWSLDDSTQKVILNSMPYSLPKPPGSYAVQLSLLNYSPWNFQVDDEDLLSVMRDCSVNDDKRISLRMAYTDAMPLVVYSLLKSANQEISNGDVFSLAGVDKLNTDLDIGFTAHPIEGLETSRVAVDDPFEPNLFSVVFLEEKDDNDDGDEFSFDFTPDDSHSLTH